MHSHSEQHIYLSIGHNKFSIYIMAGSKVQPHPLTMLERILTYLQKKSLLNLQIAFENAHVDPNMLLIADREDCYRSNNG